MTLLQAETSNTPQAGNEDMWFVKKLGAWEKQGDVRNGVHPPTLPPHSVQQEFSVETIPSPNGITPVAVYHLMRIMKNNDRRSILQRCPEAKTLFEALHEPKCTLQCAKNMSIGAFEWDDLVREGKVDKCTDVTPGCCC